MTGFEIFNKSLILLGYGGIDGDAGFAELHATSALEFLNQLLSDLNCKQASSLNEHISATHIVADCLSVGMAMLISLALGDTKKNEVFTSLYNARRAALLAETKITKDILPTV